MNEQKDNELKKRIIDEMLVDHADALDKNLNLAKQFIRITTKGKIDILFKDKLSQHEQIQLYLIGKIYAKRGGVTQADDVDNKELMNELGIPNSSLPRRLKDLRDANKIKQVERGRHTIPINLVERTLKSIAEKIKE